MTARGPAAARALQRATRAWIIGTGIALVLVIAGLIVANTFFQRRVVSEIEGDQLALATQGRLVDWAITVHEANLEQEVVRLARSEDLKEAMALGGRDRLLEQLEPPLNRLRKGPLGLSRLSLHAPDGGLLLHAHEPEGRQAPPLGERPLLHAAVRGRRIVKGLEVIGGVPYLLAASPIYRDGKFIGVLEIGASLAPVTRSLRSVTGADVAIGLPDGRIIEASSPELATAALHGKRPTPEPSRHVVYGDQRPLAVTVLPLRSFSGQPVGSLALVFDASRTIATLEMSNAVSFVIAFIGCAVAGGLLLLLSRRLDRFHAQLEPLHASADEQRPHEKRPAVDRRDDTLDRLPSDTG